MISNFFCKISLVKCIIIIILSNTNGSQSNLNEFKYIVFKNLTFDLLNLRQHKKTGQNIRNI